MPRWSAPAPEARGHRPRKGFGWLSTHGSGVGGDAITSGIEGAWVNTPTDMVRATTSRLLLDYDYELVQLGPAGAHQWQPV